MMKDGLETKLHFLQQEVKFLSEENAEIKELLRLNKEVIRIQKEFTFCGVCRLQNDQTGSTINSRRPETEIIKSEGHSERGFQSLFSQLYEENHQLYKLTESLSKQRDDARSQALIFEQIFEDATQKNLELQTDRQNQLIELQQKLEEQNKIIQDLQNQLTDFQSRKRIKQRISIRATEEVLAVLNQVEQMRMLIGRLVRENKNTKNEKKQLQLIIDLLNQKDIQSSNFASPEKSFEIDGVKQPKHQNKQLDDDNSFIENLPTKVQQNANKITSMNFNIPKLNLAKAQKIQKLNVQKQDEIDEKEELEIKTLKMQQQAKIAQKVQTPSSANTMNMFASPNKLCIQLTTLTETNKTLQKELAICRQKLQDEILLTKTLEDQADEYERIISELENTNEILIQSQLKYEMKWQKQSHLFQVYQEFYQQNNDQPYDTGRQSQRIGSLLSIPLSTTNKHKKSNISQQFRDIAYSLYQQHQIEQKLSKMEFNKQPKSKQRSYTN